MKKKQIITVMTWSTAALSIPILGQLFVDGLNWGLGDFIFAWVFFNLLGLACMFANNTIAHRGGKIVVSIIIIAVFAFVWIKLATG